ncbi:MAG: HAMP domain-containing sensor histidine kinase [Deltaproteobacteria bacterium]|nr:HAMP domain-containing sensor histidine kinase [Deltaproteobacteria bacterium]
MSIATRLWFAIVVSIALVLGLGAALRVRAEQELMMDATLRDRRFFGHALKTVLSVASDPAIKAQALVDDVELRRSHIDVSFDSLGREPAWLRAAGAEMRASFARGEVVVAKDGQRIRTLVPIEHLGRRLLIELDEPLDVHAAVERLALIASVLQALALVLLAGGATWVVVRQVLRRPLQRLAAQARRIGEGELDARSAVSDSDELRLLSAEMNLMAEQISRARRSIDESILERAAMQETLRHGDRLRTVGQLAASLAHELGTPLNTMLGHAKLIERRKTIDDASKSSAQTIVEQIGRMTELIRDLLDFGRKQSRQRVPHDVSVVLKKIVHLMDPIARKSGASFVFEGASQAWVLADEAQLLQVFSNLAMNAIQAMPQGGPIRLSVSVSDLQPPNDVRAEPKPMVCVAVIDQGIGIAEQDQSQIFEPFFTSKNAGEGTGLGLSVAHSIVLEHGGWIACESVVDEGTRMRVYLPCVPAPAA